MNIISPKLDTPLDSNTTKENGQSNSSIAPAPMDFSKLLTKQELPEFMLTGDLPTALPIEPKVEKSQNKDTTSTPADEDTEAQWMAYFPEIINPVLSQITIVPAINNPSQEATVQTDENNKTQSNVIENISVAVTATLPKTANAIDNASGVNNTDNTAYIVNKDNTANTANKILPTINPDLNIEKTLPNQTAQPDLTEAPEVISRDSKTQSVPIAAPVIKNNFEKLLTSSRDNKFSANNVIADDIVDKPKSSMEVKFKAILADSAPELVGTQAISTASINAPSLQTLPNPEDNKYLNVLSQFGSFINSQTTPHTHNDSMPVDSLYTNTTTAAETFRKTPQLDTETKIELLPATLENLNKETYNANIKIYPPELGHVLAKLKVDKNTAELVITADNNIVKQIIEAHLPQLRENFQSADITLTHIHVQTSQDAMSHQDNSHNQQSNQTDNKKDWNRDTLQPVSVATAERRLNSIIDTYA